MIDFGDIMDNNIIEKIVKTAHHIYDKEMILGKAGNISILDESKQFMYITASGTDFKSLSHEDVIKVNINDLSYISVDNKVPSMETNLHVGVYKNRSDVNSVVHVHSPGSKKLAKYASDALKNEDKILLKDHGVITVGKNIDEATLLCEYIEGIAKTQYITHVLNL